MQDIPTQHTPPPPAAAAASMLSLSEAVTALGLRPAEIHRHVKEGRLKADTAAGEVQLDAASVHAFLDKKQATEAQYREELGEWFTRLSISEPSPAAGDNTPTPPAPFAVEQLVLALAEGILLKAAEQQVRDLYMDPVQDGIRLLLRSPSGLAESGRFTVDLGNQVRAQIKKKLGCPDAADTPGHTVFSGTIGEQKLDLGVSLAPTLLGEHLHVAYRETAADLPLAELGYSRTQAEAMERLLDGPPGLLLATGSADASADQHRLALAAQLAEGRRLVVSLEHERHIKSELLVQLVIPAAEGTDFSAIIRSVLRMSPDVIFLDDVRNAAEAAACLEAASAGIMVVAQMRATDNVHALKRFVEFTIAPHTLQQYLLAVINRLSVRSLCPHCRQQVTPVAAAATLPALPPETPTWEARGCDACHDGFSGRRTVFDIWPADDHLADLLEKDDLPAGDLLAWGRTQALGLHAALADAVRNGSMDAADAATLL